MARFSVSIWCAYDMHIPHTPKHNYYVSYTRQSQFSWINCTQNKQNIMPLNALLLNRVIHFRVFSSK